MLNTLIIHYFSYLLNDLRKMLTHFGEVKRLAQRDHFNGTALTACSFIIGIFLYTLFCFRVQQHPSLLAQILSLVLKPAK